MLGNTGDTFKQRHLEAQLLRSDNKPEEKTWRAYVLALRDAGWSAPAISREIYRSFHLQVDQKTVLRWLKQAEDERTQRERAELATAKPSPRGMRRK